MKAWAKTIILSALFPLLSLLHTTAHCQNITLWIVDSTNGEAIPYANIQLAGSRFGTVTKSDGSFLIDKDEMRSHSDSLMVSVVGYGTKTLAIKYLEEGDTIQLQARAFHLDAAIVTPKPPEEYIRMAIREIPVNYVNQAFNATIYYKSSLKLNGKYIGATEAIMKGYIMPVINKSADSTRLEMLAFRHFEEKEKAINSIRKGKKEKVAIEGMDTMILRISEVVNREFGVYFQIDSNYIKYLHLNGLHDGNTKFWFENAVNKDDMELMKIGFSDKSGMAKQKGSIFLEQQSLAIESCTYSASTSSLKLKLMLWVFGIGFKRAEAIIAFSSQKSEGNWIPDLLDFYFFADIEKNRLFAKDIPMVFEMTSHMSLLEVHLPADDLCLDGKLISRKLPLENQFQDDLGAKVWSKYATEISRINAGKKE